MPSTHGVQALQRRFPAVICCRLGVSRTDTCFVAHLDILLPQHQIILNRAAPDCDTALRAALDAAAEHLVAIAKRDPQHVLKAA